MMRSCVHHAIIIAGLFVYVRPAAAAVEIDETYDHAKCPSLQQCDALLTGRYCCVCSDAKARVLLLWNVRTVERRSETVR